ncbi:MAG: hypothetical protein AAF962_15985 [Actinomycetota bacterium]
MARRGPKAGPKRKKAGGKTSGRKAATKAAARRPDPSDTPDTEVRFIQPYEATKSYLCPGCNGEIPPGQGHLVAVPPDAPDLRRHWHRGCWMNRATRY